VNPEQAKESSLHAERLGLAERAFALHAFAVSASLEGKFEEAIPLLREAILVETAHTGEIHENVAFLLHQLAVALEAAADFEGAKRTVERSLEIKAQVFGTGVHPDVADSLDLLALLLRFDEDLGGARRSLERSLAIRAQVFGTDRRPDVAASLRELSYVQREQGDSAGARKSLERLIEIQAALYGTREHYAIAGPEWSLGLVLLEQGETEAAKKVLEHAHFAFLQQFGPLHNQTVTLGEFLQRIKKREG
jgi:tetratricopeptide (TPR) repeat protein